jgi:hypothetical protein
MGKKAKFKKIRRLAEQLPKIGVKSTGQLLNHNRKMKDIYNRLGEAGVNHYANAVIEYVKQKNG